MSNSGLVHFRPNPRASIRLFCFPYAGGSAQIYRDWPELMPGIDIYAIQPPGRGKRMGEPAYTRLSSLAEEALSSIYALSDKPFALFGHSMGALAAYETARLLRERHGMSPKHLFVSGRQAPHRKKRPKHDLPDDDFIAMLKDYNGTPEEVIKDRNLMEWLLPTIRADFEMNETYEYTETEPLDCAISVFGGLDDPLVSMLELEEWETCTSASCTLQMFPGDHFFLHNTTSVFLQVLTQQLSQLCNSK